MFQKKLSAKLSALLVFFTLLVSAQSKDFGSAVGSDGVRSLWNNTTSLSNNVLSKYFDNASNTELKLTDINGSPYYVDEFLSASIYFDNKLLSEHLVRFNLSNNIIELKFDDNDIRSIRKSSNQKFKLLNSTILCLENNSNDLKYYLQLIESSNSIFLLDFQKKFDRGHIAKTSLEKTVKPSFKDLKKYFIYNKKTGNLKIIHNKSRKSFLKSFDSNEQEKLKQFIKANKLNVKKEKDLLKVIKYILN